MFDRVCGEHDIEHRLTKPNHPWTNGQVERMNRTLKQATVHRYHYGTHAQLKQHLHAFLMAYNFAKRLKTLRGLTPYEHICNVWTTQPNRFRLNPLHHTVALAGLLDGLKDHANSPLTQLKRVSPLGCLSVCHDSILSKRRSLHQSQGGSS